jgi:signal transduction protein with GAF and PtsI domain
MMMITSRTKILGDVCDRSGVGSLLAIPILNDRATTGWLVTAARSPHAFDDQRSSTLAMMSTLIGSPIVQAQAAGRLESVFDAFEQAESSTSRRYGGSGLGLSISRALCGAMGFALQAISTMGVGSTFSVEM